jgi:Ca2+-binding RTX toxin-like protein
VSPSGISGTAGSQVIEGGTSNDALIGGAGGDTFRFLADFGQDTIYDFVSGTDKLDLTTFGIDTIEELDVVASITQVGTNTVIQFDGTDERITIRGLTKADLGAGDFVISA